MVVAVFIHSEISIVGFHFLVSMFVTAISAYSWVLLPTRSELDILITYHQNYHSPAILIEEEKCMKQ